MRIYLAILMLSTLASSFELTAEQRLTLVEIKDDEHVQHCVDDVKRISEDMKKLADDIKHHHLEDIFRVLADIVNNVYDFRDKCSDLTPQEIRDYIYNHLNEDGKKCVDGVVAWKKVADLIQELADGSIDFRKFIDQLVPFIQGLPDLVEECKNIHWK